jgi:fimbrial chaperone protein
MPKLCSSLFCFLLGVASSAVNAQMSVAPIRVEFAPGKTSHSVALTNDSARPMVMQPTVFLWKQTGTEEQLTPTRDILAAPPIIEIAPGQKQTIRLALREPASIDQERQYRLILREVPSTDVDGNAVTLKFALSLSLPMFVVPTRTSAVSKLTATSSFTSAAAGATSGALSLHVANAGNGHSQITAVAVQTEDGRKVDSRTLTYVLPGGTRRIEIPWSGAPPKAFTAALTTSTGTISIAVPSP